MHQQFDRFTILITGGAGYIGSHTVLELKNGGYDCLVLDNLVYGHQNIVQEVLEVPLIIGDIGDKLLLNSIFESYNIAAVIHFAAYAYVGESITNPQKYYYNNVVKTLNLIDAMVEADVKKIVFSSTCATYGIPTTIPIPENHPQHPINPYGRSKYMVEQILQDYDQAYGLKSIILRYFNAAGAHPHALLGENHQPETHLIPLVLMTALGLCPHIAIYGQDYPTPDGTCIRDYIHVEDLASAHHLSLEKLLADNTSDIFNLGNGQGYSVQQVIDAAQRVTGQSIPVELTPRRPGDPPVLVGSSEKARTVLGWNPQYIDLDTIISHAWSWHCS
ncbi:MULTISPECIES: UDP-glucose 4-epimerase GalE [unclassified Synechocystis]|uniref:UDP-glucose 4-epimerase GalE n=1 Tax=unclassified Synechocystis TaxID=2640012 RepID=UPI000414A6F9|nr:MULTISPECIES: UDP-glucose 4-epimerase GalE [unclassified Synechocystis]AIE74699.1 UDP-glucose 4-epimerase [Synechocystis sp. PCC 6714]MCT0253946.1 UDP-glucose 4-epimerase GalE [Synechocystis sp. CS-94]